MALELGADFIEPDLVVTQDGVLIALHTVDLNVTTNVEQVFGDTIQPWYSETAGRAGYWTFNFTWHQIQQLRVRQRLPTARTTAFDGLLRVPSLAQILQILHQWNFQDLPARLGAVESTTSMEKYRSGVYAEFKEAKWIRQDSGMDIVDMLFDSIATALNPDEDDPSNGENSASKSSSNNSIDAYYWRDLLPCLETVRYDEYMVPGLVLQSFDAHDLQRFHEQWHIHSSSSSIVAAPEPPYILLMDHPNCWKEELWADIGEEWRSFLSGIGCDKTCLLGVGGRNNSTESDKRAAAALIDKAEEFGLVLHPWTERPEREFVVAPDVFASTNEELHYLLCKVRGVHGVFTESVDAVLRVRCDDHDQSKTTTAAAASTTGASSCDWNSTNTAAAATALVGIGALVVGIVGTLLGIRLCHNAQKEMSHPFKRNGVRATQIPQIDDEDCIVSRNSTSDLQFA